MLSRNLIIYILVALAVGLMNECNIINPKEVVPTYIHIDSFKTKNNFSHDISAVWVYYNNSPIGVFDLPATFPVMATGTGKLLFAPGIAVDGRNSQMKDYPFYTMDTLTLNEQPGKIVTHQPTTSYYPSVKQTLISDFEGGVTNFGKWAGNVNVVPVGADSLKFDGAFSGAIMLNAVGDSSIDSTVTTFTIPDGQAAFIEFDYNTTIPFAVGLEGEITGILKTGSYFLAGVRPSTGWKKFYLNVQAFANRYRSDKYRFYLKATLGEGQTSGRLLIDNIKLVTF